MIVLAGLLIGAGLGTFVARKHGGKPLDLLQYAAGFGIAFALLGLFVTVFLNRM
jgi:F0F1-type ATP synthase assembly protein I